MIKVEIKEEFYTSIKNMILEIYPDMTDKEIINYIERFFGESQSFQYTLSCYICYQKTHSK